MRKKKLLAAIERSRHEMNQLSKEQPLLSNEMIAKSRQLDEKLNLYQRKYFIDDKPG